MKVNDNFDVSKTTRQFSPPTRYFKRLVLQPTSLCNLNCSYCYLADRKSNHKMPIEIAQSLANEFQDFETPISIIWHGGEPLVTGHSHFENLLIPFNGTKVCHAIQTNATLIDDRWCELFKKYSISIGISLDGPGKLNSNRVDFSGKETITKVENGINLLKKHKISFGIIAVVNKNNIENANNIIKYAIKLGGHSLAVNFEEIDGINTRIVPDDDDVINFWKELWEAWSETPQIRVREFDHIWKWLRSTNSINKFNDHEKIDLFPTIAWNGDVTFLSPEFHSLKSKRFNNFIVGNVLKTPLFSIMNETSYQTGNYILEYLEGVTMCRNSCTHFHYCKGGQASNKYAEHGKLNVTETISCRNSRIRLINAIFENGMDSNFYNLFKCKIDSVSKFQNPIHDNPNLTALMNISNYNKFSDWDDFDRINWIQWDDDGNQTGIEIGGH